MFRGKSITISCTDRERSALFYERVLGAFRLPGNQNGCTWYRLGDLVFSLMPNAESPTQAAFPRDAMAMLWLEVDDLAAAHQHLIEAGVRIADAPDRGPYLLIADPDGLLIEVWQRDADAKSVEETPDTALLRRGLISQYRAALTMLQQAIERCPDDLWLKGNPAFWQVAYHTAFFTHIYLQPNEAAFKPWEHHREEYQFLGNVPWPPHRAAKIEEPYERSLVLDYVKKCLGMVEPAVDALDLAAPQAGFWWYRMSKVEHQIMNVRHIQHHTTFLIARLRGNGADVEWIAPMESP